MPNILQSWCLKWRCWQGRAPSEACGRETFSASFILWCLPAILGISQIVNASLQPLPPLSHGCSLPGSPLITPVIPNEGPALLHYYLILTNYISNNPISKGNHILWCFWLRHEHIFLGYTIQHVIGILQIKALWNVLLRSFSVHMHFCWGYI